MEPMKPIVIKDLEEEKYHSQEGKKTPLFSYSTAKTVIQKSPWHAWLSHPKLGSLGSFKQSKAMDTGNFIHELLLGKGAGIEIIPFDSYRSKDAQEMRDTARENKKAPILAKDYEENLKAMEPIKKQIELSCPEFFGPHESELSVFWEMNNGVKCQSRFDWISKESALMIDLKTTTDSSPETVERLINNMCYDVQESMYTMAANQLWPELAGRWRWYFIFIEVKPPYAVSVIETSASYKHLGEMKAFRASDTWKICIDTDTWPGYGMKSVEAPGYALKKEEMIYESTVDID